MDVRTPCVVYLVLSISSYQSGFRMAWSVHTSGTVRCFHTYIFYIPCYAHSTKLYTAMDHHYPSYLPTSCCCQAASCCYQMETGKGPAGVE